MKSRNYAYTFTLWAKKVKIAEAAKEVLRKEIKSHRNRKISEQPV